MGQIFHICLRSGPRWLTPLSPLRASLTVKYPLFFTPSLTCGMKRWCWKSSRTAWQSRWRRCGQVCQYMCFYLDVYVCVAPTFAGIVFVFVLYLDECVYCKCSIGLCRPGFGEVTALHIAVLRGHLPLVSLLTSAGGHLVLVLLLFLAIWPFTQSLNIRTGTKKVWGLLPRGEPGGSRGILGEF